jgi:hypothetical protein
VEDRCAGSSQEQERGNVVTWNANVCRSLRTTARVGSGLMRKASAWKTATWTRVQAAKMAAAPNAVSDGTVRRRAWNVAAKITRSITPRPSATLSISRPVWWRA